MEFWYLYLSSKKLNIDVDDFKNAQIGINNVSLDDKGKYFCEFGFTKGSDLFVAVRNVGSQPRPDFFVGDAGAIIDS